MIRKKDSDHNSAAVLRAFLHAWLDQRNVVLIYLSADEGWDTMLGEDHSTILEETGKRMRMLMNLARCEASALAAGDREATFSLIETVLEELADEYQYPWGMGT